MLFQGRYSGEIIEKDSYLLEVSRYIHLNPVRANMVEKHEEYEWSSYSMFIGLSNEKLVNTSAILLYFKKENNRVLYKRFVESVIKEKNQENISIGKK